MDKTKSTDKSSCVRNVRATHWAITTYGENTNIVVSWQKKEVAIPDFIRVISGGLEKGEKEQHLHGQWHFETIYGRAGRLMDLLPSAHIEKARKPIASQLYSMKSESAIGDKLSIENSSGRYVPMIAVLNSFFAIVTEHINLYDWWELERKCGCKAKACKMLFDQGTTQFLSEKNWEQLMIVSNPQFYRAFKLGLEAWLFSKANSE